MRSKDQKVKPKVKQAGGYFLEIPLDCEIHRRSGRIVGAAVSFLSFSLIHKLRPRVESAGFQ